MSALAGNHDRRVAHTIEFAPCWETPDFDFPQANCGTDQINGRIQIIGHHHPAASVTDA